MASVRGVVSLLLLLFSLIVFMSNEIEANHIKNELNINQNGDQHIKNKSSVQPALIVISYDAFRPEYFQRNVTPFMNHAREIGSSVAYLKNVFPTKTFVNHHTIATGLYPSVHGVLANSLYDLKLKEKLDYSYELFHYNKHVIPIWTLNEQSGGHSGCMMWPGSNFPYGNDNITCTFTHKYNTTIDWKWRVDTAMSWLKDPETPANLIMMYFEEPDKHGHAFSPDSEVITDIVNRLDSLSKYIQDQLIAEKLDDRVNVIHLSDHGMASVTSANFIDFTKWLENGTYHEYGSSPVLQVVPVEGYEDDVYDRLEKASTENGHFKVYNDDNLPKRWFCQNHQRLGPITAVADVNYAFQDMFEAQRFYDREFNISVSPTQKYGVHGYDNADPSMRAIFFANGPQIRKHNVVAPFDSIDLFNLFCMILDIDPVPNNGSMANIVDLLVMAPNGDHSMWPMSKILGVSIPLILILFACLIGITVFIVKYKRRRKSFNVEKGTSTSRVSSMEGEKLLQNRYMNDSDET